MVIESLLTREELTDIDEAYDGSQRQRVLEFERARKLIFKATNIALKSVFEVGSDMPVGAVASHDNYILGTGMASDNLTGQKAAHAERMAIINSRDSTQLLGGIRPDTLGVTMEPCPMCQDFIAANENIKKVIFAISRRDAEQRGLVRYHSEDIFGRAEREGLPFDIIRIMDPRLAIANEYLLDYTERNRETGAIRYHNDIGLARAIQSLNNIFPGEPELQNPYDELVQQRLEEFGPVRDRIH